MIDNGASQIASDGAENSGKIGSAEDLSIEIDLFAGENGGVFRVCLPPGFGIGRVNRRHAFPARLMNQCMKDYGYTGKNQNFRKNELEECAVCDHISCGEEKI